MHLALAKSQSNAGKNVNARLGPAWSGEQSAPGSHWQRQQPKMTDRSSLTPELITFATRMYDAARTGQLDIFQQALLAGLPVNMTNDKGDSLVCRCFHPVFPCMTSDVLAR